MALLPVRSRFEIESHGAEFGFAVRGQVSGCGRWPGERDVDEFAATDFARGLDAQRVLAGGEARERRFRVVEGKAMLAGRARRTADAVDRKGLLATAAPPPLAQVGQPLAALLLLARLVVLGRRLLVPDRKIRGDLVVGPLDPDRDVGTMVFRHVQARHLDRKIERRRERRRGNKTQQAQDHGTHAQPRQWMNNNTVSSGITSPRPTIGQVIARWRPCRYSRNRPVIVNTTHATANRS